MGIESRMALVKEYHGSLGVWVEELYRVKYEQVRRQ